MDGWMDESIIRGQINGLIDSFIPLFIHWMFQVTMRVR